MIARATRGVMGGRQFRGGQRKRARGTTGRVTLRVLSGRSPRRDVAGPCEQPRRACGRSNVRSRVRSRCARRLRSVGIPHRSLGRIELPRRLDVEARRKTEAVSLWARSDEPLGLPQLLAKPRYPYLDCRFPHGAMPVFMNRDCKGCRAQARRWTPKQCMYDGECGGRKSNGASFDDEDSVDLTKRPGPNSTTSGERGLTRAKALLAFALNNGPPKSESELTSSKPACSRATWAGASGPSVNPQDQRPSPGSLLSRDIDDRWWRGRTQSECANKSPDLSLDSMSTAGLMCS